MPILAKNIYVLLAKEVLTDAQDGTNSIIKIFDRFAFNIDPVQAEENKIELGKQQIAVPIPYAIATSWIFNKKIEADTAVIFKAEIFDPDGKSLDGPSHEYTLPKGIDRINLNFNAQGIPVTKEGQYKLQASISTKENKLIAKNEFIYNVELAN